MYYDHARLVLCKLGFDKIVMIWDLRSASAKVSGDFDFQFSLKLSTKNASVLLNYK